MFSVLQILDTPALAVNEVKKKLNIAILTILVSGIINTKFSMRYYLSNYDNSFEYHYKKVTATTSPSCNGTQVVQVVVGTQVHAALFICT